MRAKRFMKYGPHPEADKRAAQMVYRGSGRTGVDVVRSAPPSESPTVQPRVDLEQTKPKPSITRGSDS